VLRRGAVVHSGEAAAGSGRKVGYYSSQMNYSTNRDAFESCDPILIVH
jgi:hypothetical protein